MTSKRYLITGGAGFVGSHLADRLLTEGCEVTIIDDLSTGRWENIARWSDCERFHAIIADMDDERLAENEIPKVDFVFHLASAVGVKNVVEKPVETIRRIVRPTEKVVDVCAKYRKPVLLTSTSEVYGQSERIPFREDENVSIGPTVKPRWAYATAKMLDEFYLLAHYQTSALPVRIVRLFNTVGPRQVGEYGMVLPRFVAAALAGEPLIVHGDGKQRRCFCSVADVVEGLTAISRTPETAGQVINLGTDQEIAIGDLAKKVIEVCESKSGIIYKPYAEIYGVRFDDMRRRVPSLERAKKFIGWEPKVSLDEIIRQIKDFLQSKK